MTMTRPLAVPFMLIALACTTPVAAQPAAPPLKVTTAEGLSLRQTISVLTQTAGVPAGEAISLGLGLEVGTTPFSTSSGGFVFKLDPSTGLQVRTATTFGPSFAERALTAGEGKVSVGVNFMYSKFDRLDDRTLEQLPLRAVNATTPANARTTTATFALSSKTVVISGALGVTDNFDLGVSVPLVTVQVDGISSFQDGTGRQLITAAGGGKSVGIGDIGGLVKYRFIHFGTGLPDPGGVAVIANVRMPTGDRDNFRGLGVTRTLLSGVISSGKGRFRPHGNAGFEYWSKGVDAVTNVTPRTTVRARNQFQYAAGVELEATPKLTVMADLIGRHILGAGQVGFQNTPATLPSDIAAGVTSFDSMVALPEGIRKLNLVPGLKLNLKGNMVLSLNAIVSLQDNGLHARFTPVVGIDLTK